jgi:hypothetical protein
MSKEAIQAQIDAMPDGPRKDLAAYMNNVYSGEADAGWAIVGTDYRYDLLEAPIWTPPEAGQFSWSDASAITQEQHDKLAALKERAGSWFYLKDGQLIFVSTEEWEQIKRGEQEP